MCAAPLLTERLTDAFDMARSVHNGHSIKGTNLPYLVHILDVCSIAMRHGADEDQAIAALLHDVVEDGGGAPKLEEIGMRFGDRVAGIVLACSDSLEVDPTAKSDWWTRKISYVDHLREASPEVALVSAADKLSNLRATLAGYEATGDSIFARFRTGRMGTLWYYRRLAEILPSRLPPTDLATRLGTSLQETLTELYDAIGPDAEADWVEALAEERARRQEGTA